MEEMSLLGTSNMMKEGKQSQRPFMKAAQQFLGAFQALSFYLSSPELKGLVSQTWCCKGEEIIKYAMEFVNYNTMVIFLLMNFVIDLYKYLIHSL